MKTRWLMLIAALFISLLLFGCSDSDNDSASGSLPSEETGGGTEPGGETPPITDPGEATVGSVSCVFGSGSSTETMIANGADFRLVRATVLDTDGIALANKTVSFTTTAGSFDPENSAITDADGLAQINFVAPNNLGSADIRANADGVTSTAIVATFVPGPPASMYPIYAAPRQVQPAGEVDLLVRIVDANGFPVEGETISFTLTQQESGLPLISPAFTQTNADGQVTATYIAGASGGTQVSPFVDTIQAETTNGVIQTVDIEIATDAVVVSNLRVSGENTTSVGNSVGITASIESSSENKALIPVTFTLSDFSLGDLNGGNVDIIDDTNINGDAFVTFNAGTSVGTVTVSATASGFTTTHVIDLTAAPPANLALSAAPNPVFVDSPQGRNQADIVATVTDSFGNPVTNERVNFNIFIADNETGGSVAASATTNLSGVARAVYSAGGTPGTDTVTAEATSAAVSNTVDITAQPDISKVASILVLADKNVLPAGDTANIVVTAQDSSGNPVEGVTLTVASDGASVLAGNGPTDAAGEVSLTLSDTAAEDVNLTVTAGTLAVQEQFFFGPSLEFVPDSVSGIGEVILTVRLLNGNGVPIEGAPISFAFVSVDDEITEQLDPVTKANGTAQLRVTDETGGVVEISANSGGVNSSTNATINFQTEADSFTLSASADYTAVISNGNTDVTATVTNIADGTPAGGILLNFSVTGNANTSVPSATTDAFGRVQFNVSDTFDEDVIVTISDSSGALTVDVPVYFGATLQLFPATATGVADGASVTELQAFVIASSGAGIPDTPVDFAVTTGSAIISGSRINTDATGVARVDVTNSAIETATVTATAGTTTPSSSDIDFTAGDPAAMTLTSTATQVSLFGTATLTATVTDILGNDVPDNTAVNFTTTGGSVPATVATTNGVATATFDAGTVSGLYTITAEAGSVSETIDIEVQPLTAGTIRVNDVTPETVQVLGTTGEQTSTIQFLVQDAAGNPVDGETVTIFLDPKQLGGGESISSGGAFSNSVTATTSNGIAQVTVRSGTIAGTLDITAEVDPDNPDLADGDEFSTVAQVTIVGGVADGAHLTLAASTLNVAGGLYVDLPSTVTAIVADRFSNIVPDGTNVSFESECGRIGESAGFTTSTEQGQASAVFRTSNPMIPSDTLGGPAPAGRTGLCRVIAYTTGDESYYDANGNGIFDAGDVCTGDLDEPYIDANDNGVHDTGEFYVDVDKSGDFTAANLTCDSDTTIWTSMNLLMTSQAVLELDTFPSGGALSPDLAIGESQTYMVTFGDLFDNSLVAGTTLTVETVQGSGGLITGTTDLVLGDGTGTEDTVYFTVQSDIDPDSEPETIEIGVTLGASDAVLVDGITGGSIGNNNGISITQLFTVNINQPPPPSSPTIVYNTPLDGDTGVSAAVKPYIVFSETMLPQSVTNNVTLVCNGTSVDISTVTITDDIEFEFEPAAPLTAGDACVWTIGANVADLDFDTLGAAEVINFTVAP